MTEATQEPHMHAENVNYLTLSQLIYLLDLDAILNFIYVFFLMYRN